MHAELTQKHSFQNTQKFKTIAQKALSPEHRERADTDVLSMAQSNETFSHFLI